ncbi:MAG TPA: hypothetical protein VMU02_05820 [bacterium]|nr:hypothetical protein [bacterium]
MLTKEHLQQASAMGDGASILALIGHFSGFLPAISTAITAIWFGLQIVWGFQDRSRRDQKDDSQK